MNITLFILIMLLSVFLFSSCDPVTDAIRDWGEESRRTRIQKLSELDLKKWERDLEISKEKAEELHQNIEKLVQETKHQGDLSWKIARAYMKRGLHEQALPHMSAALENRLERPDHEFGERISRYDNAIPYFNEALKKIEIKSDLIFEAGLCYANASHDLGWEENRWKTAVYLFNRMRKIDPDDTRSLYQLALLYGKTSDLRYRDLDLAVSFLEEALKKEENDIPARFALAHLYAVKGDLDRARSEYREIMARIENLYDSGMIKGSAQKNQKYQTARENLEMLDLCISGSPSCTLPSR
jgi:tetratricopeptide (TPR) repeat protein